MVAAFALLIVSTAIMRLAWGSHLQRKIQILQQGVADRGGVASMSYLPPMPFIADGDDALPLYRTAAAADTGASPASTNNLYPSYPPFGDTWDRAAATSEQGNQQVFQLAREARKRRKGRFSREIPEAEDVKTWLRLLDDYNHARAVANTVGDGAVYKHLQGDDREAMERLLDMQHIARITKQGPLVLSELVGIGVDALACRCIHVIAPGMKLDDPEVRDRVRRLIVLLLDEEQARLDRVKPSFELERLLEQRAAESAFNGAWVLRPLMLRGNGLSLESHVTAYQALQHDNWPAIERVLPKQIDKSPPPPGWLLAITPWAAEDDLARTSDLVERPGWRGRYFIQYFRGLGEKRAAAVSLAAQLYRHDHGGAWPASLGQLVPDYLPALPIDPFHDDRRSIGYTVIKGGLPDGGDRPLVSYDAGETAEGAIDSEPMVEWYSGPEDRRPRVEVHQYRDLARWTPKQRRFEQMMREIEEQEKAINRDSSPDDDSSLDNDPDSLPDENL